MVGAAGMLGHVLLDVSANVRGTEVVGAVRDAAARDRLPERHRARIDIAGDLTDFYALRALLDRTDPTLIVNAAGALKHVSDPATMIAVNALLPHRLARLAAERGARLIHIGTDCVFSGVRGSYREEDIPDANDRYGRTKWLGEPDAPALTIRTSLIGPELGARRGLLGWFLGEPGPVPGYARAVFSGLPTITFARLLRDVIVPRPDLAGVWHVSAEPIAKLDLLHLIADAWPQSIAIVPQDTPVVDCSLDSSRFRALTGWVPPPWPDLVAQMRAAA